MRIAKFISSAGVCSRRNAEKLIEEKKVKINNKLCMHPSTKILIKDIVKVNGKIIGINQSIKLWKLYKPIKYMCTNYDPQKRKTIFDLIPNHYPRVISIGRLDYMSEGLILLTNNGDFARKLELPSSNQERVYRVCIRGTPNFEHIKLINKGIRIKNINYKKIHIKFEKSVNPYTWLIVKLKEGKNREIRKIFEYFSWNIAKLIRIQYGPYKLQNLHEGQICEIKKIR